MTKWKPKLDQDKEKGWGEEEEGDNERKNYTKLFNKD